MEHKHPDEGDVVLPTPSVAAEDEGAAQPLTAEPAQRQLGGMAAVWLGIALLVCVVAFVVWLIFR